MEWEQYREYVFVRIAVQACVNARVWLGITGSGQDVLPMFPASVSSKAASDEHGAMIDNKCL